MPTYKRIKLVIERTEDGYVAYPLGLKGAVVAAGRLLRRSVAGNPIGRTFPRGDVWQ